jgi:hypothetical protein
MGVPDPLPLTRGLLAATAKVYGPTLVTRNLADLARTGVSLLDPFAARPTHDRRGGKQSRRPRQGQDCRRAFT